MSSHRTNLISIFDKVPQFVFCYEVAEYLQKSLEEGLNLYQLNVKKVLSSNGKDQLIWTNQ
jgi:hypothetical protein